MSNAYTARLIPTSKLIESSDVSDSTQVFKITDDAYPRMNTIVDFFYFVDGEGSPVTATAGAVKIDGSPDDGLTYQTLHEGSFNAPDALNEDRTKVHGRGRLTYIRVTLTGVTDAVGFKALVTQET